MSQSDYPINDRTTAMRTLQRLLVEKAHAETVADIKAKQALIDKVYAAWPELRKVMAQ